MSKQVEAELRAANKAADAAVDEAMQYLDAVCQLAVGSSIRPIPGAILSDDGKVEAEKAMLTVNIPLPLMMRMSTAANAWRRTKGTVQ